MSGADEVAYEHMAFGTKKRRRTLCEALCHCACGSIGGAGDIYVGCKWTCMVCLSCGLHCDRIRIPFNSFNFLTAI